MGIDVSKFEFKDLGNNLHGYNGTDANKVTIWIWIFLVAVNWQLAQSEGERSEGDFKFHFEYLLLCNLTHLNCCFLFEFLQRQGRLPRRAHRVSLRREEREGERRGRKPFRERGAQVLHFPHILKFEIRPIIRFPGPS